MRETREETGLALDPADLVALSCWDPPPGLPLRIRTWFFLGARPGGDLRLAPDEVVAAEWVRPEALLARHGRGELTLYPPTWVTLHDLAGQPDVEALLGFARIAGVRRFETVARRRRRADAALARGDAEYDDARSSRRGTRGQPRHRLGALR